MSLAIYFVISGMSCLWFLILILQQEPGATDLEILNGIRYVRPGGDFQPNITLFRKVDVNGAREHPLFTYLKVSGFPA